MIFREVTFEELAAVTITSVAKREEDYFLSAAAVHLVTADEIRRSGAMSLPEALRLAAGVEVGMVNSRTAAVTMRGFNGLSANKLLPLVDGRSLYSLRFGGTIWDMRELPLQEIAQIEVIGGPAGTTWGANAVNGVINVITKSAWQTLGTQVNATAGTFHRGAIYARHGFAIGDTAAARVYVSAFQRDESEPVNLPANRDDWAMLRAGLRFDVEQGSAKTMVSAEAFDSQAGQGPASADGESRGGHILLRRHVSRAEGFWQVQASFDYFDRLSGGNESSGATFELDALHEFEVRERYRLAWGGALRQSRLRDAVNGAGFSSAFSPLVRDFTQASVFLQGDLRGRGWTTTLGVKSEYNGYTGWEHLPSIRFGREFGRNLFGWAAVSRATRIPSRFEHDQYLVLALPGAVQRTLPSPDLAAEVLVANEIGVRWKGEAGWTVDLSVYGNSYRKLVTSATTVVPGGTDTSLVNKGEANSAGAELSVAWRPVEWWRLGLTGNLFRLDTDLAPGSTDVALGIVETQSPREQLALRSSFNLPAHVELDLWCRWVGELPRPGATIARYHTLDARLAKQLGHGWEIALVGQNLLAPSHREFRFFTTQAAVARSGYIQIDWHR